MNDEANPYQTPVSPPSGIPDAGTYKPTLKQILFSFQGRIKRSQWWLTVGISLLFVLVMSVPLGLMGDSSVEALEGDGEMSPLMMIWMLILYVFLVWVGLAAAVKRWHDRNKSGWWVLISFVPLIGGIWALIENGCLAGRDEGNRYGPRPE
ncbi:MAG: DUF805 domain-containing protein [Verrucomicrobiota bacterium]